MQSICISAILNQQLETLKEILLKFPFMLEMNRAFEKEFFYKIMTSISYSTFNKNEGLLIESKSLYLFFQAGRIYKKGREEKTQRNIRIKAKMKTVNQAKGNKGNGELKASYAYDVAQFDHFEDINNFWNNQNGQSLYYPTSNRSSVVLHCEFQQLPEQIVNKFKERRTEKLKFLYSFPLFRVIDKNVLEEYLHKFYFNQLNFNTILHVSSNKQVLFIKEGSVEVRSNEKSFLPHTVEGKSMIGFGDSIHLSVKVNSEAVACFRANKSNIEILLARSRLPALEKQKENMFHEFFTNTAVATPLGQKREKGKFQMTNEKELCNVMRVTTSLKKRTCFKVRTELNLILERQKRLHLKKHFSNYYNQIFQAFSQKKFKHMGTAGLDQKLILYQIKILQKKSPNMDEIKEKLKKIRLRKMKKCGIKQFIHIKQLKNVGVSIE